MLTNAKLKVHQLLVAKASFATSRETGIGAYDARVFTPGKKNNLKRDLVLGLIFLVLLFVTAYVSKFVNK